MHPIRWFNDSRPSGPASTLRLKENSRVLDVGCGDGVITAEMAKRTPNGFVLGVDWSPQVVMQARLQFPEEIYNNLRFLQADARKLKFEEESFDVVVSRACLHYFTHPGQAFPAIAGKLKPGGLMKISCLGKGNAIGINEALQDLIKTPTWVKYFADFQVTRGLVDPNSCQPWLEKAGLTKVFACLQNEFLTFQNPWQFRSWICGNWGDYFQRIPTHLWSAFFNEFLQAYAKSTTGPFKAHIIWLHLGAVKPVTAVDGP
jgi:ubiquinone/menaquinone biosynthesis C-methylase UbiE